MIDPIKKDATAKMVKALDALRSGFTKLRTGRANAGILDHVMVDYYGSDVPLSQVASVVVEDARTISITPWEKPMTGPIEKAILKSDLGLTPNTAGQTIRINLPPLTEERRKDLVKIVKSETENARVSIRKEDQRERREARRDRHPEDHRLAHRRGRENDGGERKRTDVDVRISP